MDKGSKLVAESTGLVGFLESLDFKNIDGFFEKKPEFLKTAKVSQFDVECDWNSEISQNFQNLGFLQKKIGFPKKTLKFSKMAKGFNLAVQCNWTSKISQNVQNFGCKKIHGFCKKSWIWFKAAKGMNFDVERNWNWQFSQKVQRIWASLKK